MGSWKSLNNKLYVAGKQRGKEPKAKAAKRGKVVVDPLEAIS
jgi:hypothetical protein